MGYDVSRSIIVEAVGTYNQLTLALNDDMTVLLLSICSSATVSTFCSKSLMIDGC